MQQNDACNDYVSQQLCELFNACEKAYHSFSLLNKTLSIPHGPTQQPPHHYGKNHTHKHCLGS